jgi:hypothetical protein
MIELGRNETLAKSRKFIIRSTVLGATFERYPSYVAGLLNSVKQSHFYVVQKTNCAKILKNVLRKSAILSCLQNNFKLLSGSNKAKISFKARLIHEQLPSELKFFPKRFKKNAFIVSSLRCCVYQKRLKYITNYVLTSTHECKFDVFALDLDRHRRLANCKLYTGSVPNIL